MNRIMRNSGAALAAIFIAGSLTACGPGSASSSRSDTNPTEVSTDLGADCRVRSEIPKHHHHGTI